MQSVCIQKPAAPTADVSAAGQNRVRPFDADIRLVEVQCVSVLHPPEAEALQVKLVEQGEAVVHIFERKVGGGDPGALV